MKRSRIDVSGYKTSKVATTTTTTTTATTTAATALPASTSSSQFKPLTMADSTLSLDHKDSLTASTTTSMNSVSPLKSGKKVREINGHKFVTHSYTQPTYCGVCKTLIYGTEKQGWTCIECGLHMHKASDVVGNHVCHEKVNECAYSKSAKAGLKSFFGRKSTSSTKFLTKNETTTSSSKFLAVAQNADTKSITSASVDDRSFRNHSPTSSIGAGSELGRTNSYIDDQKLDDGTPRSRTNSNAALFPSFSKTSTVQEKFTIRIPELPEETLNLEHKLWSETVPPSLLSGIDKREIKRQELIFELIYTERGYMRQLHIFKSVFRAPLMEYGILYPKDVENLFGNLDDVIATNTELYELLSKLRQENLARPIANIADIFLQGFKSLNSNIYAKFCSNQKFAANFYNEKLKSNGSFGAIMKEIQSQSVCDRLTFIDFIAKPLQRLTKYPLLLKGILKETKQNEEKEKLEIAITQSETFLKAVQDVVTSSEDIARLRMINELLDRTNLPPFEDELVKDLLTENRHFIHEGALKLKRENDKQGFGDVHAILLSDMLLLTQIKDDSRIVLKLPGREKGPLVHLSFVHVRSNAADPKSFFIMSKIDGHTPRMYTLGSDSRSVVKEWQDKIHAAADAFKQANPNFTAPRPPPPPVTKDLKQPQTTNPDQFEDYDDDDSTPFNAPEILEQMRLNCETNQKLMMKLKQHVHHHDPTGLLRVSSSSSSSPLPDRLARQNSKRQHVRSKPMKSMKSIDGEASADESPALERHKSLPVKYHVDSSPLAHGMGTTTPTPTTTTTSSQSAGVPPLLSSSSLSLPSTTTTTTTSTTTATTTTTATLGSDLMITTSPPSSLNVSPLSGGEPEPVVNKAMDYFAEMADLMHKVTLLTAENGELRVQTLDLVKKIGDPFYIHPVPSGIRRSASGVSRASITSASSEPFATTVYQQPTRVMEQVTTLALPDGGHESSI